MFSLLTDALKCKAVVTFPNFGSGSWKNSLLVIMRIDDHTTIFSSNWLIRKKKIYVLIYVQFCIMFALNSNSTQKSIQIQESFLIQFWISHKIAKKEAHCCRPFFLSQALLQVFTQRLSVVMSFEALGPVFCLPMNKTSILTMTSWAGFWRQQVSISLSLDLFISFYFDVDHTAQNSSPVSSWSGENRQANTLTITSACVVEQRQVKMANLSGRAFIQHLLKG